MGEVERDLRLEDKRLLFFLSRSFPVKSEDYTTNENIFYSNNPLYNFSNFRIFTIENGNVVNYPIKKIDTDSTFRVSFPGEKNYWYFALNEDDTDTVALNIYCVTYNFNQNDRICCPHDKTITWMKYNDIDFIPGPKGAIFTKK